MPSSTLHQLVLCYPEEERYPFVLGLLSFNSDWAEEQNGGRVRAPLEGNGPRRKAEADVPPTPECGTRS